MFYRQCAAPCGPRIVAIDLILLFPCLPEGTEGTLVELANHSNRGHKRSKSQNDLDKLDRSTEIERVLLREMKHAIL